MSYYSMAIGTEVTFSHSTNGTITFIVVGKDLDGSGTTTLVASDSVARREWCGYAYGSKVMYPNSSIRSWLNGTFYNGFSDADKAKIRSVNKVSKDNYRGGSVTSSEKVWLLSIDEVSTYNIASLFKSKYGSIERFAGTYGGISGNGNVISSGTFLRDSADYEDSEVCAAANSQGSLFIETSALQWSSRMIVPGIVV